MDQAIEMGTFTGHKRGLSHGQGQQPQGQLGLYVQLLPVALHGPAHEPAQQPVWQRRQAADDRRLGARAWRGSSRHRAIL